MNTKTYIRPGKIPNSFLTETMNWISANLPAGITVSFRRLKSGITGLPESTTPASGTGPPSTSGHSRAMTTRPSAPGSR